MWVKTYYPQAYWPAAYWPQSGASSGGPPDNQRDHPGRRGRWQGYASSRLILFALGTSTLLGRLLRGG